nr:hypothetical protein [Acidobacteriota bacterium]
PYRVVIPFPWQGEDRTALVHDRRQATYLKTDRAAKTFFLLEGRFPDRLEQLRDSNLLGDADLVDPQHLPFRYSMREDSYTLQPLLDGKPLEGAEATEAITGNFLLDPLLFVPAQSTTPPVVLLD